MESNKISKKTKKIAEKAVPANESLMADLKPAKRSRTAPRVIEQAPVVEASKPKQASHRHSKVSVPAIPVVEEVVADVVIVDTPAPLNHEDKVHAIVAAPKTIDQLRREDIARLAYSFWEERNYRPGSPEEDWFRAVKVLSASNAN